MVNLSARWYQSLNKHWNKTMAHLREVETAMNGCWVETAAGRAKVSSQTKRQAAITNKRNNQASDFCHKASKMVIGLALERGCNTVVVGKNDHWKRGSDMGKKTNQSFVQIPHTLFVGMLAYKCRKHGLNMVTTEEAHTSKTSWIDGETPRHHEQYVGRRIARGLFKSSAGETINADVNGALQIIRKVFPNAKADGIWAYGQPLRVNVV